ncbi:MAG TPA: AMP-binding protein, partial [Gemmatimonadales bacterium]
MDIPRDFNAARWFVDRHIEEGRGGRLAIIHEGRCLTYGDVYAGMNRLGSALRRLGVRTEQRVVLLLPDGPEFVWSFWGALKIGAVPVPTNTLLKPRDYEYILRDSGATVVIAGESLVAAVEEGRARLPDLAHVIVVGPAAAGRLA